MEFRELSAFRPKHKRKRLASTVTPQHSFMSQKRHLPAMELVGDFKQIGNVFSLEMITLLIQMHLMFGHTLQIWSTGPLPTMEKRSQHHNQKCVT